MYPAHKEALCDGTHCAVCSKRSMQLFGQKYVASSTQRPCWSLLWDDFNWTKGEWTLETDNSGTNSGKQKKNALSILSWKSQRLSTRRRWMNKGDQAGHVTIWGQTSFSSRGKGFLISWCLYIHSWNAFICLSLQKKKKIQKKIQWLMSYAEFHKKG